MGLLHFTGMEDGIGRRGRGKAKGVGFWARRGGLGGVNRRIVEGLCGLIEGLCGLVEGLCKGRKRGKLLILHGPRGFLPAETAKSCRFLKKTARSVPMGNWTHSDVYSHSTVFGRNSVPDRAMYLRVTAQRSQVSEMRPGATGTDTVRRTLSVGSVGSATGSGLPGEVGKREWSGISENLPHGPLRGSKMTGARRSRPEFPADLR